MLRGATIVAKYSYLSDGTKLSATDADGNGLYYLGSLVYGSRNGDLSLESAAFNGGRFIVTSNGIESHYFVTDHLGSMRAVVNNDGEVIERNDYYPFGLRWNAGELSDNRYRYNGKETQSFVDVPYTDYGARMLDSKYRLGWNGNDPLAEATPGFSPFAFCGNNPINRVDPNGMWVETYDAWTTNDPAEIAAIMAYLDDNSEPESSENLDDNSEWIIKEDRGIYRMYNPTTGEYGRLVGEKGLEQVNWDVDILCFGKVIFKGFGRVLVSAFGKKSTNTFSKKAINEAIDYATDLNKLKHIFYKSGHKLEPLVQKLGGEEKTIKTVIQKITTQGKLPSVGQFEVTTNICGYNVVARGFVHNGVPKLGTIYIP